MAPICSATHQANGINQLLIHITGNPLYWGNGAHAPNEHMRLEDVRRAVLLNCYLLLFLPG